MAGGADDDGLGADGGGGGEAAAAADRDANPAASRLVSLAVAPS